MRGTVFLGAALLALGGCGHRDAATNNAVAPAGFHPPTSMNRTDFLTVVEHRFARLDANHDTVIEADEIPPDHHDTIAAFDVNHDGHITRDEFTKGSLALFDKADINHDGVLTGEEHRQAWIASHADGGDDNAADTRSD